MRVNKTLRGEDTTEIEKNALSKNIDFFTQYLFHKIVYYYEDVCGSFNDLYYDQCIFLTAFFVFSIGPCEYSYHGIGDSCRGPGHKLSHH